MHLAVGGTVALGVLIALPMALVSIVHLAGLGDDVLAGQRFGPFDGGDRLALTVVGLVLLAALGYAVAALGALAAVMAPVLLGPCGREG